MRRALTLLFSLALAGLASAHSISAGDLTVGHPWARATPPGAPTAAVYFSVVSTEAPDRLVGVTTPVAGRATLHRSFEQGGQAGMEHVDALPITPGVPVTLAPGGLHVMLMELKSPLVEGRHFPMTLHFERAGEVQVEVRVQPLGAVAAPREHAH
jgi:copper(I)-binding protein